MGLCALCWELALGEHLTEGRRHIRGRGVRKQRAPSRSHPQPVEALLDMSTWEIGLTDGTVNGDSTGTRSPGVFSWSMRQLFGAAADITLISCARLTYCAIATELWHAADVEEVLPQLRYVKLDLQFL